MSQAALVVQRLSVGDGWVSCIRETAKCFPSLCSCPCWKQPMDGLWEGCAKSRRCFHERCIETVARNGSAAPRTREGNACHPSISLKAINIGMTWSLFINPRCSWPGEKAQWKRGVLFALMVLTCCSGSRRRLRAWTISMALIMAGTSSCNSSTNPSPGWKRETPG